MERSFFDEDSEELRYSAPFLPLLSKPHKTWAVSGASAAVSGPFVVPSRESVQYWRLNYGGVAVPASQRMVMFGDSGIGVLSAIPGPGVYEGGFLIRQIDQPNILFFGPPPILYTYSYVSGTASCNTFELWY